ncbi:MAG TPA: MarR family winged helix-turn-helix transcriptional regulator [Anaerolineales bacterium]|nr:MarR family winged helix-turn-helix transcriptional regulator [Anaerolineales bacterium]
MNNKVSFALAYDLLQLLQQISRVKYKPYSVDGLTAGEQGLLMILVMNLDWAARAPTVTEVSNSLQITPAGVTHLLNPLEETGHLERVQDARDRRVVRVRLTDKGKRAAETLVRAIQEQLGGLVEYLGEDDSRTLIRLLSRAIDFFTPKQQDAHD